jgi:thymidylate synthase
MKQTQELLRNILINGTRRMDRTGTGTIAIFGTQMKFDLKEGFPLETNRKIFTRGLIEELLWMISGSTTNRVLIDKDVHLWDEWGIKRQDILKSTAERDRLRSLTPPTSRRDTRYEYDSAATFGDLGLVYGGLWRRWPTHGDKWILVDKRHGPDRDQVEIPRYAQTTDNLPELSTSHFPIHWDNNDYPFTLLGEYLEGNVKMVVVEFAETKSVKRVSQKDLLSGVISDPYRATIYNVGCIGIVPNALSTPLYTVWSRMMSRCYDTNNPMYRREGLLGAYVSPRWLCFENFFRDVKSIPNYEEWVRHPEIYELSTLYYSADCYHTNTATFLTQEDIQRYNTTQMFKVTNPRGVESFYMGLPDLAKGLQVRLADLHAHLDNSRPQKKLTHYVIESHSFEGSSEDKVPRKRIYVDQLAELIEGLKKKPFSRRHIVTAWNPQVLPNESIGPRDNVADGNQALTACHCMFQFFVRELSMPERRQLLEDGPGILILDTMPLEDELQVHEENNIPKYALSCQLYQRSTDSAIGLPFNIASYSLLTHMVAQVCGMVADEFIWTGGDTHIYLNHVEGVKELVEREPLSLAKLWLNPEIKNIDEFTVDDIKIKGYKPHPKMDFAISV